MSQTEPSFSIDDTIMVLSRAAEGQKKLSEITLVGGQALNFWADRYFGYSNDFVSGDIDLLGGAPEAMRCARLWDAKIQVADMDSAMGSPNTAVVLIDRGVDESPLRVDFLGNIKVHQFVESRSRLTGKHHEIYLSDIRKADPSKWKTIIRQPMQ